MSVKISVEINEPKFKNDIYDMIQAFYPVLEYAEEGGERMTVDCFERDGRYIVTVDFAGKRREGGLETTDFPSDLIKMRLYKRSAKITVYETLSDYTGIALPYGSLTGIRPTKLYYELLSDGVNVKDEMVGKLYVSERKFDLIERIIQTQKGIYSFGDGYDAFANIPVCPTRCAYCSFISETYDHAKKRLADYADNLARDISTQFDFGLGRRRAIYVGGGTPTSIDDGDLDKILRAFKACGEEFTVEAGRPETFTESKAKILKENGVTRISVNPQTFKQSTLDLIGRKHSVEDIFKAYELANKYGFDVNMDLIAMLPDESVEDFKASVDKAIELSPANITVHTLSVKRGSVFNMDGLKSGAQNDAYKMVDYSFDALIKAGYSPYYTYRQKNTFGRLENVGYAKKGKTCVYNVDIMEETHTVHASGAGAISKTVTVEDNEGVKNVRIERLSEIKEIKGYNEHIEELIAKKRIFFDKQIKI
ncbi:MAG: coproporphyrinogen dehydrogenase HemZ [Clostridia bacterium]|nr:coproporphyrinogen dehydrogenase HemZ [Clostridia bacterium]